MIGLTCPCLLKTVPRWGWGGGETSAEFFLCIWLPRHSTSVAAFNGVENKYLFTDSCSPTWPPRPLFF